MTKAATTFYYPSIGAACPETDGYDDQCRLLDGHAGPHAVALPDCYLTWTQNEIYRWSMRRPPRWLIDLPWIAGAQPGVLAQQAEY